MFRKTCKGRDCQNSENVSNENMDHDVEYDEDISKLIEPEIILRKDETMNESITFLSENCNIDESLASIATSQNESLEIDDSLNVELSPKRRRLM